MPRLERAPMRIGIISDIHSNLEALTESLAALERARPDRIFCLGDVVGYGASVNECCDLVRKVSEVTLLGNHDAAVAGRMDYSFYYDAARHALDWTASRIAPEHLEWLRSLPYAHLMEGVASRFTLRKRYKYIVSVGSVGQPRDCDNRACFVTYDTDAKTVEYHR